MQGSKSVIRLKSGGPPLEVNTWQKGTSVKAGVFSGKGASHTPWESYCVPPLPDAELVCYFCRETGSGGCFTLEKKGNDGVVERVKATHAFVVDDELNVNVKIKVTNVRGGGLSVEVRGL
ncbi:hypothetical protein E2542_SST01260 [Spatholobus suberectus]|nr:hypothetical protein E2542_SST01260 [Spatholobus suberectus]